MQLTEKQREIMDGAGHLLVTGGPGSGKTTVSILKAAQIAEQELRPGQKVLFLSFARATVSSVVATNPRNVGGIPGHNRLQGMRRVWVAVLSD